MAIRNLSLSLCAGLAGLSISTAASAVQTTPFTTDTVPVGILIGSFTTFEDALWDWLNLGAGVRFDIRRQDTATGASFSGC